MKSNSTHWNTIFGSKSDPELGWYEPDSARTLKFLGDIDWDSSPTVFLPGAGSSVLVDALLERGARLVLNDLSDRALSNLSNRLGEAGAGAFWLPHDMAEPLPSGVPPIDIWIDRAVLHFLLEEEQIAGYFNNLRNLLNPGGLALFAEFSLDGSPMCAGLPLHRYSAVELALRLGGGYALLRKEPHVFINPFGEPRPYIYALYRMTDDV